MQREKLKLGRLGEGPNKKKNIIYHNSVLNPDDYTDVELENIKKIVFNDLNKNFKKGLANEK